MRLKGAEKNAEGKILVPGDMLLFVAGHPAVYGKQMLYFLDRELSRRSQFPAPEQSGRTVEKRKISGAGAPRAPLPGESGDPDEPSEAELIELMTSGSVTANDVLIQDEAGRKFHIGREEALSL
jgi:type IV secretion system protein VirD4